MHGKEKFWILIFRIISRATTTARAMVIILALTVGTQSAQTQTFNVIHTFTGGGDGGFPVAGVTIDRAGNLYGTAGQGGEYSSGIVFKLTHKGSAWAFSPLYSFRGGNDGAYPSAGVVIGRDSSLLWHYALGGRGEPRHGVQPETTTDSLQGRTLPVDRNHSLSVHGR